MVRTPEQWAEILAETPEDKLGQRVLGDLAHYYHGRSYERDDRQQIANVIAAVRMLVNRVA